MNREKTMLRHTKQAKPNQTRRRRRGATAVEFAMVAPVFIVVLVFCAEFARMSIVRSSAQNACYETARFIMAEGATVADGINTANAILGRIGNVNADITINGADGSLDADGNTIGEIQDADRTVQVQIIIPLAENTLILPGNFFGDRSVGAQVTLRTERYNGFFDSTDN